MVKKLWIVGMALFILNNFGAKLLCAENPIKIDSTASFWVDSVMASLSTEEKIAQLLMIRTYSNKDSSYYHQIEQVIKKHKIGGLCFFQGGPIEQAKLTNYYQHISKTPLFIALDAEWGLGMRLDSSYSFPYQMTTGSIQNDSLVYQMGTEIANQLKAIGTHINFAPVTDVNNNPGNPVINSRSFGEDRNNVAQKGIAYMKGLQDNGIIATAKHFPGHGDTDSDSHYTLPQIKHSKQRIDSIELYPFKALINNGLQAVMTAHLFIPEIDNEANRPTTLSYKVVTGLLTDELKFKGLRITDALDMKGVTTHFKPGEIELEAFKAGNDILLLPLDVTAAIQSIKTALDSGEITREMIDTRCRKILEYKAFSGLHQYLPVKTDSIYSTINNPNNEVISRKIYQSAITLLKNDDDLLPLIEIDTLKVATLAIGDAEVNEFQQILSKYCHVDHYNIMKDFSDQKANTILEKLSKYNLVIVSLHKTNIYPSKNFGIKEKGIHLARQISENSKVILTLFSNPYALAMVKDTTAFDGIILAHQDSRISNSIAAQLIMGALGFKGLLPVSASAKFNVNDGIKTKSLDRLQYGLPEEAGINSFILNEIDTIALFNIKAGAMPGCQILVAKDGIVVYRKSFGYHTYKKGDFVKEDDLYDLASITKVAATTLSVMKLYDEEKLVIDQKLSRYLPYLTKTNKSNLIIREIMAHQARLKPWIPFYLYTFKNEKPDPEIFSHSFNENYTIKVADQLYINAEYQFTIYDSIVSSGLLRKKDYKYSDLGFYLLKDVIENITNQPLSKYVNKTFYRPLGLQTMGFHPIKKHKLNTIVPTENDMVFRQQLIHGYVHDPGAAMMGGVSGHAGLFSNANDLAIIMQMLLQKGVYGGKRYIEEETVEEFTRMQFPLNDNRRGIGFDKPNPDHKGMGPTCAEASNETFGHTGFTGTCAWVDPEYNLVYVFLSNRINPSADNRKLIRMNTRTNIQQAIYKAIIPAEKEKAPASTASALNTE
jgi:beta-glucosidase-like glycosyl hydrolase/CubicO group peptidase (beta-lactamase class C family)